jgi:hypothetical protein
VVMVVSAMGDTTDDADRAGQARSPTDPPAREMDMLLSTGEQVSVALMAMAIHSLGHKAVSLTGAQIGIRTDSSTRKARIRRSRPSGGSCSTRGTSSSPPASRGSTTTSTSPRSAAAAATRRPSPWPPSSGRRLRDLHRRRRRLHDRPARGARSPPRRPHQLRRDARAGQPRRGRDAQPVDRVRQEVRTCRSMSAAASPIARHDDRRRAGAARFARQRRGHHQGRGPHHVLGVPTSPAPAWRSSRASPPGTSRST